MIPTAYICVTCGVQYAASEAPPEHCMICEDERQYVNANGQQWTTMQEIQPGHSNKLEKVTETLYAVYTEPQFAIGQRAHILVSPGGNILWDCISNLDDRMISQVNNLGGLKAIALSHPHFFSTILEWSKAFGDVPIYINELHRQWVTNQNDNIRFWQDETLQLWDGIELIRCGGHFPGSTVLYSPQNEGLLLVGDTIQVSPNLKTVSFMFSYPNLIPLPKKDVLQIQQAVSGKDFNAMYGAFGKYITGNAKAVLDDSVKRYVQIFEET